jgi:hypothetical protein
MHHFSRKRVGAGLAMATIALAAPTAAQARTAQGQIASDGASVPNCTTPENCTVPAGDRNLSFLTAKVKFTGSLVGDATEVYVAATPTKSGRVEVNGFGVLSGTYRGRTGTSTYRFSGIASKTGIAGPITFLSGTGGLKNLRGTITWATLGETTFSYKGNLRFRKQQS